MINETTSIKTFWGIDSPWCRLPWTLPMALLIWAVALWLLAYFISKPTSQPAELLPIDAQFVDQAVAVTTPSIKLERHAVVHQAVPLPLVMPQHAHVTPSQQAEVTSNTSVAAQNSTAVPSGIHATPGDGNPSDNGGTQSGSYNGPSRGSIYVSSGARAIIRPMPQIPDDLREETFNSTALALFHVAVDGSVKVDLAKPTSNLRLNRILLDSLKKWRFIPATKNGNPVASTEEIIVKIEVK